MADACHLPYPDSSFDLVTSRRAPHHFSNVTMFLTEARRVLRPGGRLGVSDMSPREGTEEFMNAIERIRDQSHAKALSPSEWRTLLANIGFEIKREEKIYEEVTFGQWLYPVERGGAEELEIRKAWKNAPNFVRDLMRAKESAKGIERWSRSLVVLVASKYNHV
jgi:ubiquinone/menaquinone biosynthesis C-methylase UbiE